MSITLSYSFVRNLGVALAPESTETLIYCAPSLETEARAYLLGRGYSIGPMRSPVAGLRLFRVLPFTPPPAPVGLAFDVAA